jgi:hypothetical protein
MTPADPSEYIEDAEPCPFCHTAYAFDPTEPSKVTLGLTGAEAEWWVWCDTCRANGPIAERELAVVAWNRATRPLIPALLALTLEETDADG